jgi:hypothetical protein
VAPQIPNAASAGVRLGIKLMRPYLNEFRKKINTAEMKTRATLVPMNADIKLKNAVRE